MISSDAGEGWRLRWYGDACVLSSSGTERIAVQGELARLVRRVAETCGVGRLPRIRECAPALGAEAVAAADALGRVLLESGTRRANVARLVRDAPALLEAAGRERIPLLAMLEITHRCNERCVHCYLGERIRSGAPAHSSTEVAVRVVGELARAGCLELSITGGEPTLHPGLGDILDRARSDHVFTILKTNGTTFTKARARSYARSPASETHVSLYGARPHVHDAFTSAAGSWRRTIEALSWLADAGVACNVVCTVWKGNEDELEGMKALVTRLGHVPTFDAVLHGTLAGDAGPLRYRIAPERERDLEQLGWLTPQPRARCLAGSCKLRISPGGDLAACELLPRVFGNVHGASLTEVWDSPRLAAYARRVARLATRLPAPGCPGLVALGRSPERLRSRHEQRPHHSQCED